MRIKYVVSSYRDCSGFSQWEEALPLTGWAYTQNDPSSWFSTMDHHPSQFMMMPRHGSIFCITGPLNGKPPMIPWLTLMWHHYEELKCGAKFQKYAVMLGYFVYSVQYAASGSPGWWLLHNKNGTPFKVFVLYETTFIHCFDVYEIHQFKQLAIYSLARQSPWFHEDIFTWKPCLHFWSFC